MIIFSPFCPASSLLSLDFTDDATNPPTMTHTLHDQRSRRAYYESTGQSSTTSPYRDAVTCLRGIRLYLHMLGFNARRCQIGAFHPPRSSSRRRRLKTNFVSTYRPPQVAALIEPCTHKACRFGGLVIFPTCRHSHALNVVSRSVPILCVYVSRD